jgi:hypothetical protein
MNKGKKNSNLKAVLEKMETTPSKNPVMLPQIPHKIKLCRPDTRCGHTHEKQAKFLEKREGLLLRAKEV